MADEFAIRRLSESTDGSLLMTSDPSHLIDRGRRDLLELASQELFAKGEILFGADGAGHNYEEAIICFRKAAEGNSVKAKVRLGLMYDMGWGVPRDEGASFNWYQSAAEQGSAVGQFRLGSCYRNGIGVQRDDAKAVIWELRAAKQGYPAAQDWLGTVYMRGLGVPKDPQEAYFWYSLAHDAFVVENENALAKRSARKRDQAAFLVTEAALAQSQDRAKQWARMRHIKPND